MLIFHIYQTLLKKKVSPIIHSPKKIVDHRWRDHFQGQIFYHRWGYYFPEWPQPYHRRYCLHVFVGGNQGHPLAVNIRSPTPPNVRWQEERIGQAVVRPWTGASRVGSRKVAREREEMKNLNDKLLSQIVVLQNTRVPFHCLRGLLPRRPQATSNLKVGGAAEQPAPLHLRNSMADQAFLIPEWR